MISEAVLKEIKNVMTGKSGEIKINMVDEECSMTTTGTTGAKFSMLVYAINEIAKSEGVNFADYVEMLNEYLMEIKKMY